MSVRSSLVVAGAFVAALAGTAAANAAPGAAVADVNLRSGPGIAYAKITTVPAGAYLEVHGCYDWCKVSYRGWTGFVAARFVADTWRAPAYRYGWAPVYYRPLFPLIPRWVY